MSKLERDELIAMYYGTIETLDGLFATADDESLTEEVRDEATREALDRVYGMGERKVVRLTLAGGGPGAWLDVTILGWDITEVEWVGVSWGDRVVRHVQEGDALWRLAEYHVAGRF